MSIVGSKTRHGTEPLDGVIFILEDIFWDGHTVLMVPCPTPIAAHHVPLFWKSAGAVRFNRHLMPDSVHIMPFWGCMGKVIRPSSESTTPEANSYCLGYIISSHRIIAGAQVICHSNGKQATIIESILFAYVDHIDCHNWRHWMKDETHLIRYAPICTGNGVQRVKQVHRPRRQKSVWDTSPMTRLEH